MKSIIIQNSTVEQQPLLDISVPINKQYAEKFNFEHILTTGLNDCPDRPSYWNKIVGIRNFLNTTEDANLVVYLDNDSIAIGNEDLNKILPTGGILGMVPLRGGIGGKRVLSWHNSGCIAMINNAQTRDFFDRVWARGGNTDEHGLHEELRHHDMVVADGKKISNLDPKWNCWKNNAHLCPNPTIKSFHGMRFAKKLTEMANFLNKTL